MNIQASAMGMTSNLKNAEREMKAVQTLMKAADKSFNAFDEETTVKHLRVAVGHAVELVDLLESAVENGDEVVRAKADGEVL